MAERPEITRLTRIGELLEAYPELEDVLIAQAPAFRKLRNPVLRRTVARLATVEKAAAVGGIDPARLVAVLRDAAGEERSDDVTAANAEHSPQPTSLPKGMTIAASIDADELLEAGRVPLGPVGQAARRLGPGEAVSVTSAFRPEPLVAALGAQGFRVVVTEPAPGRFETFVYRADPTD